MVEGVREDTRQEDIKVTREVGPRAARVAGPRAEKVTKDTKEEARQDMEVERVTKEARDGIREVVTKEGKEEVRQASPLSRSPSATASSAAVKATWPKTARTALTR